MHPLWQAPFQRRRLRRRQPVVVRRHHRTPRRARPRRRRAPRGALAHPRRLLRRTRQPVHPAGHWQPQDVHVRRSSSIAPLDRGGCCGGWPRWMLRSVLGWLAAEGRGSPSAPVAGRYWNFTSLTLFFLLGFMLSIRYGDRPDEGPVEGGWLWVVRLHHVRWLPPDCRSITGAARVQPVCCC